MEKKVSIEIIDGIEIFAVRTDDGSLFVPIRPVCERLGIASNSQVEKIKAHPIMCKYLSNLPTSGSDGKTYEMACLADHIVEGWLLTINPGNVSANVRDTVMEYQERVFLAIHWFNRGRQQKAQELLEKGRDLLERERNLLDAQLSHEKAAAAIKKELNEVRKEQKAVQEELMDPKPDRLPGM